MGDDKDPSVHKMDTLPPPDAAEDAYSATTKVGPVTPEAWAQLILDAERQNEISARRAPATGEPKSVRAASASEASEPPEAALPLEDADLDEVPSLYNDDDDEPATLLHGHNRGRNEANTEILPATQWLPRSMPPPAPSEPASDQPPPSGTDSFARLPDEPPVVQGARKPNEPISFEPLTEAPGRGPLATGIIVFVVALALFLAIGWALIR